MRTTLIAAVLAALGLSANAAAFERSPWSSPVLIEKNGATEITVGDRPSGLLLRQNLDAKARYFLKVRGAGGPFTMRLTADDGPRQYLSAPDGEFSTVIANSSNVELLFYSDRPAQYRLDAATLEKCTDCKTEAELNPPVHLPPVAGLEREPWNKPALVDDKGATDITVATKPAGLMMRGKLDANERYQLKVKGGGDPFTLRITINGQPPQYVATPAGQYSRTIEKASDLELLFYSDTPAHYRVDAVSLEKCSQCTTGEDVNRLAPISGFDRSIWNDAVVTDNHGATDITVQKQAAGLYWRIKLDPKERYVLKVKGSGDPFTMRVTSDGQPPNYASAPIGETTRTIDKTSALELLFYFDRSAHYRIQNLSIEKCARCFSADDLKKRIEREIPDLLKGNTFELAARLLKWAANTADYSPDTSFVPLDFESWPAEKAVEFFDDDTGGVSCGGMAVFAQNIFQMFGLDALTINFGIPNSALTHVTTIVNIDGKLYLMDPTFAGYYEESGRPVDLKSAFDLIKNGNQGRLSFRELGLAGRDVIRPGLLTASCVRTWQTAAGETACHMSDIGFFDAYADFWRAAGVKVDDAAELNLMRVGMFSVSEGIKPETRQNFVELLKSEGISMHSREGMR